MDDQLDDLDLGLDDPDDGAIVDGLVSLLDVCARLRERREARGMPMAEVARRSGCERSAIEWLDDGDVAVPAETLVYYAAALGLTVRFLVEGPGGVD